MSKKQRNLNLDALRGVAILLVLGRHFECFPLWTRIGWAGVDLFFVLSGFLISGLLFEEWKSCGSIQIKRFYVRRALKIYPSFYALLFLTIPLHMLWPSVTPHPVSTVRMGVEMLFVQNYFSGIWGHTWSLAVEEHFYLILPVILWLMTRARSADPFRHLQMAFLAVATLALMLRLVTAAEFPRQPFPTLTPTHLRIDSLLFGVVLSYYRHFRVDKFAQFAQSRIGLPLIGTSIILLFAFPIETVFMHTLGFTFMFLGAGSLLAKVIDLQTTGYTARAAESLAIIGTYSYSIYLWHFGIARLVPQSGLVPFLFYIAMSVSMGMLAAKVIEYPVLAFRDKVFPSLCNTPAVAAVATIVAGNDIGAGTGGHIAAKIPKK